MSKKYVKKDQLSHVLLRPEMYIGAVSLRISEEYIAKDLSYEIVKKDIKTSPAILRIFIEILSNAIDNYQRSVENKIPCSYIKIYINKETGETKVVNDGDFIPIKIDETEKIYNHTLIFGNLLSGSNFDDEQDRYVSGRNGIGATACNIFSKKFIIQALDPDNKKTFEQTWTNNMRDVSEPIIGKAKSSKAFTSITYFPDFERFGMKGYTDDIISQYMKYIIDTSILTKVKVYFNDNLIPVNNLTSYSKLFNCQTDESISFKGPNSECVLTPAKEFEMVTFVNGIFTKLGGTHLDAWSDVIFRPLLDKINKKGKPQLNIKDIKQYFRIFVIANVVNPQFESQSKYKLESPKIEASVKTSDIAKIMKWSVINDIQDIIKSKEMIVLKKSEKKKKGYVKIEGLDNANYAGTKNSHLCSLILCEGLSAKTYAVAGIEKGVYGYSGRNYNGILALGGKLLNCRNSNPSIIAKNKVITDLIQAIGLQHGVDYTIEENYKNLQYGRVILLTDADCFTDDTALLVKQKNKISIVQIDSLFDENMNIDTQLIEDTEVWSDTKWIPIQAIRRKTTNKKILTINTYSGLVRCTEDHTLLLENGKEIKAKDIKIGDRLLRNRRLNDVPNFNSEMLHHEIKDVMKKLQCYNSSHLSNKKDIISSIENELKYCSKYEHLNEEYYDISEYEAWFWGFFFADGTCDIYTFSKDRQKTSDINTEKSRKRWRKWVEIHSENVNKYNLIIEELKNNKKNYGHISKKLSESKMRLQNAIENCNRTSKEMKNVLLRTNYSFNISNCDYEKLNRALKIIKNIYDYDWKIIEVTVLDKHRKSYRLILNGGKNIENFISTMRKRFYTSNKLKKVPDEILNNNTKIQESFFNGYYDGDGFRWLKNNKNSEGFDILGQVGAQGLCYIAERLGYSYNIKEKNFKSNVFTIHISKRYRRFYPGEVKYIYETDYTDRFVYDIETVSGKINAGVGNMIQRQCDGIHISGLIMNFLHALFPSVLKRKEPFLVSMQTPIVRVFNKGGDILFYDENRFKDYVKKQTKNVKSKYYKGLGTTKIEDVPDTFGEKMVEYVKDDKLDESINKVFHKDFADERKKWLENYNPNPEFSLDDGGKMIEMKMSNFVNNEVIKFSHEDCKRSIPSLFDGLKESQRKVLYSIKKRNLLYSKPSLKVAQLGGYVAEHTNYHHGEQNLYQTIVKMAHEFPGSNNIPLLYRDGQFGSRNDGGSDAASPRYIFTKMEPLTPLIFREEDDVLLNYIDDDGDLVEPEFYIPIIPMILVNGCTAIGTGWSSSIPCYNPKDLIECIKIWLNYDGKVITEDERGNTTSSLFPELLPWYRGFTGKIESKDNKIITYGTITKEKNKVNVTELPIGMWTNKFKEMCEDLIIEKKIKSMNNNSTVKKVNFTLTETEDGLSCNLNNLKLHSYLYTTNMVVFNEKYQLKKYNIDQIINDFCYMRYDYYKKRKQHIIKQLEKELRFLSNKERFITEIINKKLNIMNVDESILIRELEKRGYDKENIKLDEDGEESGGSGYNYLLRLPVRTLTSNQVKKIQNDILSLEKKLDYIIKISEKNMWINDLNEFEIEYEKWLKIMEIDVKIKKNKK